MKANLNNTQILDDNELPLFQVEWLRKLQHVFPDSCPKADWSERQIWMAVGSRNVVKYLEEKYAAQLKHKQH